MASRLPSPQRHPAWVGPRGEIEMEFRVGAATVLTLLLGLNAMFLSAVVAPDGVWLWGLIAAAAPVTWLAGTFLWSRKFRSRTVAEIAVDLAHHGLFRGWSGWRRLRTMKRYDKRAIELNHVVERLKEAEWAAAKTLDCEPRLLDELFTRRTALEDDRDALFTAARRHFQTERDAAGHRIAIAQANNRDAEALSALAAARHATYRPSTRGEA